MKVFVAGASGAIGRPLVKRLVHDGHEVLGMMRPAEDPDFMRQLGAKPVHVDVFDQDAIRAVLIRDRPMA